jgi:hypothetical protein
VARNCEENESCGTGRLTGLYAVTQHDLGYLRTRLLGDCLGFGGAKCQEGGENCIGLMRHSSTVLFAKYRDDIIKGGDMGGHAARTGEIGKR